MNCITQIHNVKNTPIYFIVAGSPVRSPAQLHECLQPTLSLHRPLQPIFTAGCACVYTTSSSSDCCLPWSIAGGTTEDHNSPYSTADPPQHCRPPTALAKDHMVVDAVEPHGLTWADFVFLLPSWSCLTILCSVPWSTTPRVTAHFGVPSPVGEGLSILKSAHTVWKRWLLLPRYKQLCKAVCSESVHCSVMGNSLWPYGLYSLPGYSVLGILQARILKWVAIPFSGGSPPFRGIRLEDHKKSGNYDTTQRIQ